MLVSETCLYFTGTLNKVGKPKPTLSDMQTDPRVWECRLQWNTTVTDKLADIQVTSYNSSPLFCIIPAYPSI